MSHAGGADFPASLVLVGAGKMGGAMLRGWLDLGLEAKRIRVVEPHPSPELNALCAARGVALAAARWRTRSARPRRQTANAR